MTTFEECADRLIAVESRIGPLVLSLAELLHAPLAGPTRGRIPEQLAAIETERPALRDTVRRFNRIARHPRARDSRAEARIRSSFKGAAFRLKHWDRITAHLAGLTTVAPVSLDHGRAALPPGEAQTRAAIEDIYRLLHMQVNPNMQDDTAASLGAFPDIALKLHPFLDLMQSGLRVALAQRRPAPMWFVDVGCGGGTKLLLAHRFFDNCVGLEYDAGYAASAERAIAQANATRCSIRQGDALEFEAYDRFDVIYFFRPLSDPDKMAALEARIAAQARPGTILLAPYDGLMQRYRDYGLARIGHWIYLAGADAEAARGVVAEAELIGLETRWPNTLLNRRLGFWEPAIAAAYDIGYGLSV